MVRSRFPHLKVEMIRGNVGTRLSKLDNGQYDTLVMAVAGLKRSVCPIAFVPLFRLKFPFRRRVKVLSALKRLETTK